MASANPCTPLAAPFVCFVTGSGVTCLIDFAGNRWRLFPRENPRNPSNYPGRDASRARANIDPVARIVGLACEYRAGFSYPRTRRTVSGAFVSRARARRYAIITRNVLSLRLLSPVLLVLTGIFDDSARRKKVNRVNRRRRRRYRHCSGSIGNSFRRPADGVAA